VAAAPPTVDAVLWQQQVDVPPLPAPASRTDDRVEVAIVGGGYAGLSAARVLADAGRRVLVLEKGALGWGAHSRNGGMAIPELKAGPVYKASISLASPVFGYAMGQHAADWLEGRSIPQAMDILPSTLSTANIARYEADLADPGAVYRDPTRRDAYLKMYGNICYETRDRFVNFAWSSERRP